MCGILGYISTTGKGPDIELLQRIAVENEVRGDHAFGLAWADKRGDLHCWKAAGSASQHVDAIERVHGALAVIGHCRWATHGSPLDNSNNHPHRAGTGWLVHNGIVANYRELAASVGVELKTSCDSEAIAAVIGRHERNLLARSAWTLNRVDGALAVMGLWTGFDVRLVVARRGRPLSFGKDKFGTYLASLPNGLPGEVSEIMDDRVQIATIHGKTTTWDGMAKLSAPRSREFVLA